MSIITLTTDLGSRDHYVASLKGTLLSLCPNAQLVDISHDISPFNILEAAFILNSCFPNFPPGTIHLLGIDPEGTARQTIVAMQFQGHTFLAPDNGILSLIKKSAEAECIAVDPALFPSLNNGEAFLVQRRLAPIAAILSEGKPFSELGQPCEIKTYFWGEPSYTENALRGVILHIDRFGNAITNIQKDEFMRLKGSRSFQIFIRNLRLQRIVTAYGDVSRGEALAIFSETGHLELALREGSTAQLLGLKVQDMLTIEFYG